MAFHKGKSFNIWLLVPSTKDKLSQLAQSDNRSLNNYINNVLLDHIEQKKAEGFIFTNEVEKTKPRG